jgi:hypothetical protein
MKPAPEIVGGQAVVAYSPIDQCRRPAGQKVITGQNYLPPAKAKELEGPDND